MRAVPNVVCSRLSQSFLSRFMKPHLFWRCLLLAVCLGCASDSGLRPLIDAQQRYAVQGASPAEWVSLGEAFEAQEPKAGCEALFGAAISYYDAEAMARAAAAFERLLSEYPTSPRLPETLYYLAVTYDGLERSAESYPLLNRLVSEFPGNRYAKEAARYLSGVEGGVLIRGAGRVGGRSRWIVVDAGHGGADSGAVARGGRQEKEIVLDIARRLTEILTRSGYDVLLTRNEDRFVPLPLRNRMGRQNQAGVFVSLHVNWARHSSASGIETWVAPLSHPEFAALPAGTASRLYEENRAFAAIAQRTLTRETGARDRGVKEGAFRALRGLRVPAILVEMGFLSNRAEAARLERSSYRQLLAEGLARAILSYTESSGASS